MELTDFCHTWFNSLISNYKTEEGNIISSCLQNEDTI